MKTIYSIVHFTHFIHSFKCVCIWCFGTILIFWYALGKQTKKKNKIQQQQQKQKPYSTQLIQISVQWIITSSFLSFFLSGSFTLHISIQAIKQFFFLFNKMKYSHFIEEIEKIKNTFWKKLKGVSDFLLRTQVEISVLLLKRFLSIHNELKIHLL